MPLRIGADVLLQNRFLRRPPRSDTFFLPHTGSHHRLPQRLSNSKKKPVQDSSLYHCLPHKLMQPSCMNSHNHCQRLYGTIRMRPFRSFLLRRLPIDRSSRASPEQVHHLALQAQITIAKPDYSLAQHRCLNNMPIRPSVWREDLQVRHLS